MTTVFKAHIDDTPDAETPYASAFQALSDAELGDVLNIRMVGDETDTPLNEDDGTPITYFLQIDFDGHDSLVSPLFTPNSDYTWQWDNVTVPVDGADVTDIAVYSGSPGDATLVASDN